MFVLGNAMTKFNGLNYVDWSKKNQFQQDIMDLDMTLIMDEKPTPSTEDRAEDERSFLETRERSNRLSWNLMTKLKSLDVDVNESFPVRFIINSLPLEFGQFNVNYNTIKEKKRNFQEIKVMLVQEEGMLKKMKDRSFHLTTHDGASCSKVKPDNKDKKNGKTRLKVNKGGFQKKKKCYFYKENKHFKKECPKRNTLIKKERDSFRFKS
ncbi:hypothetical protein KIW84_070326 [Lathyrus oleraceus]|uniref:Uncharacterized protein n=1 Tax=Pisum sativum TaxID=3888 RepID=A0A9D4VFF9_PEA|nr:hypothetical protein KIW84_070326 [Pisum sativum]